MTALHAPTLRRVIEMLDGEIADASVHTAVCQSMGATHSMSQWTKKVTVLRAFRERLERELTTTEAPK